MSKEIKIAGSISFGGKRLNVYGDLDAPLFKAKDISHAIGYSSGNEWRMLEMCEEDEKLKLPLVVAGHTISLLRAVWKLQDPGDEWFMMSLSTCVKKKAEISPSSLKSGTMPWITFTSMRKQVSLCSLLPFLAEM